MGIFISFDSDSLKTSLAHIEQSIATLNKKVDDLMASFAEAKQAWVDYAKTLLDQNAQLRQALTDAQSAAQANADALATFQADDAATDAQQLADQAQAFADDLTSTLDGLQNPPTQPDPLPDTGGDSTPPDTGGDATPPDTGGDVTPGGDQ